MIARAGNIASLLVLAACSSSNSGGATTSVLPPPPARGTVVARVAGEPVTAEELRAFARRERISDVRIALDRFVDQRLLAQRAIAQGALQTAPIVDLARRAAVQTLLIEAIEGRVTEQNVPPAALAQAQRTLGFQLTHGPISDVVHAVVTPAEGAVAIDDPAARRARAEAIRTALLATQGPLTIEEIRPVVARVTGAGSVRVEAVLHFDPTGATGTPQTIDATFARAASELANERDISPVVESSFGFHVMVLQRREPAAPAIDAREVERQVREEALTLARARASQSLLTELRTRYRVSFVDTEAPGP